MRVSPVGWAKVTMVEVLEEAERTIGHGTVQTFYFDADLLLKRHDYDADILGGVPAAHYVTDHVDVSGIPVPTRRWVVRRLPDGTTDPDLVIVSIGLREIAFDA